MAVIKQTAKGKTYYYSRHSVDGKRPQVRIPDVDPDTGRKINTDAKRKAYDGKIAQQYSKGDLTANDRRLFGELIDEWVKVVLPTINKAGSRQAATNSVKRITQEYSTANGDTFKLSSMRLKNITPQHLTIWLTHMGTSSAWNTRNITLGVCRRIFEAGIEWGWITRNPATASTVKLPRKPAALSRVCPLGVDHIKRLLDASKDDTEYRRHTILIGTGLRRSEFTTMRSPLIDATTMQYHICPHYGNRDRDSGPLQSPKTEASAQSVFLDDRLLQILQEQIRHVAELALATSDWPHDLDLQVSDDQGTRLKRFKNDFIWPVEERFYQHTLDSHTEAGQLDTGDRIAKMFKRACKRAGLEPTYSIHDLRHTCASLMINNNCNIKTVQRQMRHATATETLNTYSHFWNEKGREAVEVLSKAVGW